MSATGAHLIRSVVDVDEGVLAGMGLEIGPIGPFVHRLLAEPAAQLT